MFLDTNNKEFFLSTVGDIIFANYIFEYRILGLRGGIVQVMISLALQHDNLHRSFSKQFLRECSEEIRAFPELDEIFLGIKKNGYKKMEATDKIHAFKELFWRQYNMILERLLLYHLNLIKNQILEQ
jgi:hypothetical protein